MFKKTLLTAGLILASTTASHALTVVNVIDTPNQGNVAVTGYVSSILTDNEFVLRDGSGSINVETNNAYNLSVGDKLTVQGFMDNDASGKEIDATTISNHTKNLLNDSRTTNVVVEHAPTYKKRNHHMNSFIDSRGNRVFNSTATAQQNMRQQRLEGNYNHANNAYIDNNEAHVHTNTDVHSNYDGEHRIIHEETRTRIYTD